MSPFPRVEFERFLDISVMLNAAIAKLSEDKIEVYLPGLLDMVRILPEAERIGLILTSYVFEDAFLENVLSDEEAALVEKVVGLMGPLCSEIDMVRDILDKKGLLPPGE